MESETFAFDDFRGEVASTCRPADLAAEVRRLADPSSAEETIHWGRNYLYRTSYSIASEKQDETFDVVVKQFRNKGFRAVQDRRLRGSKAERSWRMAKLVGGGEEEQRQSNIVEVGEFQHSRAA